MNDYLVDTDWIIDFLKGKKEIVEKLQLLKKEVLMVSIISLAELYEGVYSSEHNDKPRKGLENFLSEVKVVGIDKDVCKIFGKKRAFLRKQGHLIDNFDLLIASICLRYNCILVTGNIKHFNRISDLRIADFCIKGKES